MRREIFLPLRGKGLAVVAAALHLAATLTVFLVGRFKLLPNFIDEHGIAISFASDGIRYRREIGTLLDTLNSRGFVAWLTDPIQFHDKLYSLPVAAFGMRDDFNVLVIEPLNILYYLAILYLTFKLGCEVLDKKSGLYAAAVVAVWPSLLLHTTQLLRDPLYIVAMLAMLLVLVK